MKKNPVKVLIVIMLDLVIFAGLLLSFAWFHHARPKEISSIRSFDLPTAAPSDVMQTEQVNLTPDPNATPTPTHDPDATSSPIPSDSPTRIPRNGLLGDKYAEKFTDGEIICDEHGYRSSNICIEMSEHAIRINDLPVHYFVADIYIQDINCFRCALAENESHKDSVVNMANANNAIVALSGDYFYHHNSGLAIRNGQLLREKLHPKQDVCVLYADGTMETYLVGHVDRDYIYSKSPLHAWSFGPRLLENGLPMTSFNTSVEGWNPRAALGYYEPGHYCFVIVDGRQEPDYSYGMQMQDLSKLMYDLGCKEAYNLDGGMTAMMAYNGSLYSHPCGGGRSNSDILYIAEPN